MTHKLSRTTYSRLLCAVVAIAAAVPLLAPRAAAAAAAQQEGPAATNADNAALAYWQAFAVMPAAEEQERIIEAWDKVALDQKADALIDASASGYALSNLRRGARMGRCDWGLDYSHGPDLMLPHLAKGRQLARLALLRARRHFEQGRPRDGVVDALAAMQLGRHLGTDPIMISILVQYAVEQMSADLLARHLSKLSPEELDHLAEFLDKQPAGDRMREVWATETRYMVDWVGERLKETAGAGDDWGERVLAMPLFAGEFADKLKAAGVPPLEEMLKQLEPIREHHRAMEQVMDLPPAEQDARLAELARTAPRHNLLYSLLIPSANRVVTARRKAHATRALLRAAVAVQRGGPERLKDAALADPFGQGPFAYRKTGGGFELESKVTFDGKPVVLVVGGGRDGKR